MTEDFNDLLKEISEDVETDIEALLKNKKYAGIPTAAPTMPPPAPEAAEVTIGQSVAGLVENAIAASIVVPVAESVKEATVDVVAEKLGVGVDASVGTRETFSMGAIDNSILESIPEPATITIENTHNESLDFGITDGRKINLVDAFSIRQSTSNETGVELSANGNSIATSVTQGQTNHAFGTTYTAGAEATVKAGDTSIKASDNASFDSTFAGFSANNEAAFSFDNGKWHDDLNLNGGVVVSPGFGGAAHGEFSHEFGTDLLSVTESITGHSAASIFGVDSSVAHETSAKIGKNVIITGSDTVSGTADFDDASISREIQASAGFDNGVINDKITATNNQTLSFNDGLSTTMGVEHESGINNLISVKRGVEQGVSFDGEKVSMNTDISNSVRLGNDDFNVEQSQKASMGVDSDGTVKYGGEVGASAKAGAFESGAKASANNEIGEDKEAEEVGVTTNSGVQVTQGAKITHETSFKAGHSTEKGEDSTVEEDTMSVSTKTRIEVDYENATAVDIAAAAVFNTAAAITETIMNEVMKFSEKTEENDEDEAEEADATQDEAESEKKDESEDKDKSEEKDESEDKDKSKDKDESEDNDKSKDKDKEVANTDEETNTEGKDNSNEAIEAQNEIDAQGVEPYYGYGY